MPRAIPYIVLAVVLFLWIFVWTTAANAHWKPGTHNTLHAINWAFCGRSYKPCQTGREAIEVARCETGGTFSVWARNGQYRGIFQMGVWERATFGHGNNPWAQAAAAYRYYRRAGWKPWQCRPDGGLRW